MDLIAGEINVIKEFIHSGDLVFDVGAFHGEWTNEVLKRYSDVILHQFEPIPKSFNQLVNNFSNCVQNNCAVSDKIGITLFYDYYTCPVLSTIHRRNNQIEKSLGLIVKEIEVLTTTIDCYCKQRNIEQINFLKIDTEGNEFAVLQGAEKLLADRKINYIQFEYGGCYIDAGVTLKEVFNFLINKEYKLFKISHDELIFIEKFEPELENYEYSNFLAKAT